MRQTSGINSKSQFKLLNIFLVGLLVVQSAIDQCQSCNFEVCSLARWAYEATLMLAFLETVVAVVIYSDPDITASLDFDTIVCLTILLLTKVFQSIKEKTLGEIIAKNVGLPHADTGRH